MKLCKTPYYEITIKHSLGDIFTYSVNFTSARSVIKHCKILSVNIIKLKRKKEQKNVL